VPTNPESAPVLTVYSPAAPPVQMFQGYMACDLQGDEDGVFRLSPFLDSTFVDAGLYSVVVRYEAAGGAAVVLTGYFNLLPGGSDGGPVIAMYPIERPDARYLIQQYDSGALARGRNPR
jgi:hypothetical protein